MKRNLPAYYLGLLGMLLASIAFGAPPETCKSVLDSAAPHWNFHKYLIDRSGNRVMSFESSVTPNDAKLAREIERMLSEQPTTK
jgi:glutathione peroxidase